jgi:hypothetical protein
LEDKIESLQAHNLEYGTSHDLTHHHEDAIRIFHPPVRVLDPIRWHDVPEKYYVCEYKPLHHP